MKTPYFDRIHSMLELNEIEPDAIAKIEAMEMLVARLFSAYPTNSRGAIIQGAIEDWKHQR